MHGNLGEYGTINSISMGVCIYRIEGLHDILQTHFIHTPYFRSASLHAFLLLVNYYQLHSLCVVSKVFESW
jgi:hypothetical protein